MKCKVLAITCLVVCMNGAQAQLKEESSLGCTKDIECIKGRYCNVPSRTCDPCAVWMDQIDNAPKKCKEDAMATTPEPYGGCKVDEDCDAAQWCFERRCVECSTLKDTPEVYRQRCPNQEFSSAATKTVANTTNHYMTTIVTTTDQSSTMMETKTSSTPNSQEQQKPVSLTLEILAIGIGVLVFMAVMFGLGFLCNKLKLWGKNRDFPRTEYISMDQFFVAIGNATAPQEGLPCDKREDSVAVGIKETDEKEDEVSKDEEEPIVVQDEAPSPSSLVINEVTPVTKS